MIPNYVLNYHYPVLNLSSYRIYKKIVADKTHFEQIK